MSRPEKNQKRTQAARRAATRSSILASARKLFGERGYQSTSLQDIASDCELTIRPIYYHFESKRGLFAAVNQLMEARAMLALSQRNAVDAWESFVQLCQDPAFRQVILVDAPDVLGRERWQRLCQLPWAPSFDAALANGGDNRMAARVALAALTEAAMVVAESGNDQESRAAASRLITTLLADNPTEPRPERNLPEPELT